jgi:hypothetical protein
MTLAAGRKMLFAIVPVQTLAKYGNSNSYFCDPYKNDITNVSIGTHGLATLTPMAPVLALLLAPPRG